MKRFQDEIDTGNARRRAEREAAAARHQPKLISPETPEIAFSHSGKDIFSGDTVRIFPPSANDDTIALLGWMMLWPETDGTTVRLGKIHIDPWFRRRGFGTSTLERIIKLAAASGFRALVGEMAPEGPEDFPRLQRFYKERLHFQVAWDGNPRNFRLELVPNPAIGG